MRTNETIRVLSVFGTRPEAIKLAPVIRELASRPGLIESLVCSTAQHRQMLDQVLNLFNIVPDYDLKVMQHNQSLAGITVSVLGRLDQVLKSVEPDWVLTQGDTTTTFAATVAAFYRKIRVAHIEAGLRTWNRDHPFPEEINRKFVDAVASLHFVPTATSRDNLLREGIPGSSIIITGNTVIDALFEIVDRACDWKSGQLSSIPVEKRLILVTAHRRENFGRPLIEICGAVREIAAKYPDVHFVYPMHLNPNVQQVVKHQLSAAPGVSLIEPLEYLPFVHLMKASYLVLTDSGGLQEEAPALGKPVLLMRNLTERPEAVASGAVRVIGTDRADIIRETSLLLDDSVEYSRMSAAVNPYGDGRASARIVDGLLANRSTSPDHEGCD
jgi:UDP-N-acetylglucosamine 2-epimerase